MTWLQPVHVLYTIFEKKMPLFLVKTEILFEECSMSILVGNMVTKVNVMNRDTFRIEYSKLVTRH